MVKVTYAFHSILEVDCNIGRNSEKCCWLKIHLTFWKNAQKTFQFLLTGYMRLVLTLEDLNGAEYMRLRLHISYETQSYFCFIRYLFRLIKNIACQTISLVSASSLQLIQNKMDTRSWLNGPFILHPTSIYA